MSSVWKCWRRTQNVFRKQPDDIQFTVIHEEKKPQIIHIKEAGIRSFLHSQLSKHLIWQLIG